jgi:hypothetical protein
MSVQLRSVVLSVVLSAGLVACSDETPTESLETSVQAVSVSPTTVYPTPGTSPSPSGTANVIARWCEELAQAVDDQDRAIEIYREGEQLPNAALATAAGTLASPTASEDEVLEAGQRVERSCERTGVDLTD